MIPLIRARPGIRIPELASLFGVREQEIWDDITEVLTLCGVPPYLPHNYFVFSIHGDRVSIRFAEHLARPVHLTLQEALAIDLALRSVSGGRPPLFGDAAPRLRKKLRDLLRGPDRQAIEAVDRRVIGLPTPDLVSETIGVLKDAMSRNRRVEIEYYTASRDAVSRRRVDPYGLVDHRGYWYLVARDGARGREVPFRVDRIREVVLTAEEYEVPDTFTTEDYRRDEMWREGPETIVVRVRFSATAAPRAREDAPRRDLQEAPGGSVIRSYRIDPGRPRWLLTHLARHGPEAEVLSPPAFRSAMAAYLDLLLGGIGESQGPGSHRFPDRAASAAAAARPPRPRTRRRPSRQS
jgi:proteasome accessory factor C